MKKYNNYDWFMIIDDDSYLYYDRLVKYLSKNNKDDSLIIGDFIQWRNFYNKDIKKYPDDEKYYKHPGVGSGIIFTKNCIREYQRLIEKNNVKYDNHDVWLDKLYNKNKNNIKRINCGGFHQNLVLNKIFDKKFNNNKNDMFISIHLQHNMDLLSKLHNF